MRSQQNKILSSIHKGFKKLIALPYSDKLTSIEARTQRLHDTRHELSVRKARLKIISAQAKGKRKELLQAQLRQAEIAHNEIEKEYQKALLELNK